MNIEEYTSIIYKAVEEIEALRKQIKNIKCKTIEECIEIVKIQDSIDSEEIIKALRRYTNE